MKVEFRNTTQVGNNVRTEMFFNDIRVAELHCTPVEKNIFFAGMVQLEQIGMIKLAGEPFDDKH